ncbi:MAG: hypothetical protein ABI183_24470 [Polyangiaceae bacterium]
MSTAKEKSVAEVEHDLKHASHDQLGKSEVALGAIAGAVVGAMAGPPGAVVGAVIGAAAGAVGAAATAIDEAKREQNETELDNTIGVNGDDLGAPNLKHPPSKRGSFSVASSGAGGGSAVVPAEGPTPPAED